MQRSDKTEAPSVTVPEALADLLLNPKQRLLGLWNWKAALLSACIRGTVFFCVNIGAGIGAAIGAMCLEAAFYATVAGFFGAMIQAFRRARPVWAAAITVMLFMPAVDHTIEYALHYANGTKKLAASIAASVSLSMLSSVFNLFAMRRGVLIVGDERASLIDDLRRLPRVIFDFVMTILRALWRIRICHRDTEKMKKKRAPFLIFHFSLSVSAVALLLISQCLSRQSISPTLITARPAGSGPSIARCSKRRIVAGGWRGSSCPANEARSKK